MSKKQNQNKKIALIFLGLSLVMILLSINKISKNDTIDNQIEYIEINTDSNQEIQEDKEVKENYVNNKNVEVDVEDTIEEFSGLNFDLIVDGQKINGTFYEGENLYSAMDSLRENEELDFKEKEFSGLGVYIYSINNISEKPREGKYWIYYVNDVEANFGVSNYILKEKDQIKWQLENNQD